MVVDILLYAPIAQFVEFWIPGSDSPGSKRSGARYMILLTGMVRGRWQRPRPVEVSERGGLCPVRLCGQV